MSRTMMLSVGAVIAGLFLLLNSAFVVNQTEQALVLEFGKPVDVKKTPGLKFKMPFVQNVIYFDNRLLDFDAQPITVLLKQQDRLIVDAFVRYKIVDPLRFYQTMQNEWTLSSRLSAVLKSTLQEVLGKEKLETLLSPDRSRIMRDIRNRINSDVGSVKTQDKTGARISNNFGIQIVDVRITRTDLPAENSTAIFTRMRAEREKEAKNLRAQGEEQALRIRSEADKERTILLAEAQSAAEKIRGQGDAEATRIYAQAFSADPNFYDFYRSMQAYRKSFNSNDTTIILSPQSDFLRQLDEQR